MNDKFRIELGVACYDVGKKPNIDVIKRATTICSLYEFRDHWKMRFIKTADDQYCVEFHYCYGRKYEYVMLCIPSQADDMIVFLPRSSNSYKFSYQQALLWLEKMEEYKKTYDSPPPEDEVSLLPSCEDEIVFEINYTIKQKYNTEEWEKEKAYAKNLFGY